MKLPKSTNKLHRLTDTLCVSWEGFACSYDALSIHQEQDPCFFSC